VASGAALISQEESSVLSTLVTSLGSAGLNVESAGLNVGTVQIKNLLLISSLLSLLVGTIAGLSQIKVKRLLAFSSISHVGFLLLALGIYTQKSVDSFIFYLVQYSITSLNIFLILLAFGYLLYYQVSPCFPSSGAIQQEVEGQALELKREAILLNLTSIKTASIRTTCAQLDQGTKDINYLIELKGQLHKNPLLSISLAICLFSMAGIPPLIGFFSKQFVLFSSIENGNNFLSIVAILVSVISASYYLKLIKITFFSLEMPLILLGTRGEGRLQDNTLALRPMASYGLSSYYADLYLSNVHSYIIAILTFLILFFFLYPSILLNGTQLISLTIFNL
jgi:NADH-ubiquinone oxidoreductase chain 2